MGLVYQENSVLIQAPDKHRDRKAINALLFPDAPARDLNRFAKDNIDTLPPSEKDVLAAALGAPARQVIIRAEEVGPKSGWRDGFLTAEYGFVPPDSLDSSVAALANSPGRIWSDLCERMPGCVARGRVRDSIAALPVVEATEDVIPDSALWAALVALGMLCSICRYEDKHDGHEGVSVSVGSSGSGSGSSASASAGRPSLRAELSDDVVEEVKGLPRSIGLPYFQVSKRMGRPIPHLTFVDQSSYNVRIRDHNSTYPYVARFDNMDMRWPMFGDQAEMAFLKGVADTSASFQHGPDAIAACQECVMNRDVEGLLRQMVRLKEILEMMPNAFHTISPNPMSGDNYVPANEWVRWAKFSAPLSKRCPASSGLQFPPYLLMDAFLARKKYDSFLGAEGIHLRAWEPSNLRAFIAAVEGYYSVPEFVMRSGDARLMGVLDGIVEAYTGERGFMGVHRYKVFGILEVAGKTGRTETNGASGAADAGRPWEETHRQFSEAMKERLEPYRSDVSVEPHQMRGSFAECRYKARILGRSFVDNDADRGIAMVTLDIQDTGITFQPGDRLAVMPLNSWEECAKVAASLGLDDMLNAQVPVNRSWARFADHLGSVSRSPRGPVTVRDVLRRGHLAPLTQDLVLRIHSMLRASSNTALQVLATDEWPVRGSLGDLLQSAVMDTPQAVWDSAFNLQDLSWLCELVPVETPRTYSISSFPDELLPSTVDLSVSRSEYLLSATFAGDSRVTRCGVSSGFLNPVVASNDEMIPIEEDILIGVSRPQAFQLPLSGASPCAFFAGGSGIAPFRSFWQSRIQGGAVGRNILYLGVQSRDKFCYEHELRQHVGEGQMEVHVAFSRDSRGLAMQGRDLVERATPPRYIDSLIAEQGSTVCDLVMSKKHGGLGGHLYVCGSVAVFDSVMKGIRQAIYNHRTSTLDSAEELINAAFAERRFMLDVFMTPRPLPCNLPTIPLSQLALNTGHRGASRVWIAVHGKVYDVTDFCPMHPGGTLIIKSNAGVDCTASFDNLAHTTNPEVSSLLTKYFVGHLTPKPDFHGDEGLDMLHELWSSYLRTSVETLVAHQMEMNAMITNQTLDPSRWWYQGPGLLNIKGVRSFYQYQSRLLQTGFSALFGSKFQELILKLSFSLANASPAGPSTHLPDVLGVVARAKTSGSAIKTSREIARVGEFVGNSEEARFHERGIIDYASKSVELDVSLLEDVRAEACAGMDAFDALVAQRGAEGPEDRVVALATFLMQLLERVAKRLEIFYANLAQYSVYQPTIERNPARTRWRLVRSSVRDGSFFVLTQSLSMGAAASSSSSSSSSSNPTGAARPVFQTNIDFDRVMSQVRQGLGSSVPSGQQQHQQHQQARATPSAIDAARGRAPPNGPSAFESYENGGALTRMSSFIDKNMRSIRRLSRMPTAMPSLNSFADGQLGGPPSGLGIAGMPVGGGGGGGGGLLGGFQPTPPSSRGSSVDGRDGRGRMMGPGALSVPPSPPMDATTAITAMMGKFHGRKRSTVSASGGSSSPPLQRGASMAGPPMSPGGSHVMMMRARAPSVQSVRAGSLKSFKLSERVHSYAQAEKRVAPTF
ncbi:putative nadph-ferrihemoprotein reductase [Diaporthe ampelina]|uniref:NADPH--hemoprotein reductase n=1 Tax=Diaporthe ampelina TaxID=1214573 RepID=A0A0G2FKU0_9PEZI|nr:putative nadph-ferrihemoprotein reductase [Diaporthe ampelina]